MAWTNPRNWVANEVLSASLMNAHVRDNLSYLLTGRNVSVTAYIGADFSTSSGSWVPVDASNVKVTITPQSSRVAVFALLNSSGPATYVYNGTYFGLALAGGAPANYVLATSPDPRINTIALFDIFTTGITVGVPNTFQILWHTVSGQVSTVNGGASYIKMIAWEM